jgi:hypothetical protein
MKKYLSTTLTKKQISDSGMAVVMLLLLLGFFTANNIFYKIAIPALLINMIVPKFFYPFAVIWLSFANILGTIISRVILTVIYLILVLPIGLIRKSIGKDVLQLKEFKKGTGSIFKSRNLKFLAKDLENPY